MSYEDLVILIPSHSLEDFPTELPDAQASSLLNSFVVPWHPRLLASAQIVPRWHRADAPPEICRNRLILIPTKCNDVIPAGFVQNAKDQGATVLQNLSDRAEMVAAALAPLGAEPAVDPELVGDFFALGYCYLQIELLTRHMRHFSSLDEVHFQREAIAAAQAALVNDAETVRTRLRSCFDLLLEARERFFPVDCYLLDLCLVIPRLVDDKLRAILTGDRPTNLLLTGQDLEEIARDKPAELALLKEAWQRKILCCLGGEYRENPSNLLPVNSWYWNLAAGRAAFQEHLGQAPKVWARRRFGVAPPLPPWLLRQGYIGALHVALDDGFYPDQEFSKVRWEGLGGMAIEAFSRIPLAADSANSYLRFPVRMSESMDNDHLATVIFAHWPEVKAPWFEDLQRIQRYAPVLGRFVTFEEYFEQTENASRLSAYDPNEYLTPFFVQGVARQEPAPLVRYRQHLLRRRQFDALAWCAGVCAAVRGEQPETPALQVAERALELGGPDAEVAAISAAEAALGQFAEQTRQQLAQLLAPGTTSQPGTLVVNPLSFARTVVVSTPEMTQPPRIEGPVKFTQFDGQRQLVTLQLPAAGFVWLPHAATPQAAVDRPRDNGPALAENMVLRNEFFEAFLHEETGGLRTIKLYGRSPNRLSSHLAFRFPRERKLPVTDPEKPEVRSYYSQCRMTSSQVTSRGPSLGEIVTRGEIFDQVANRVLAEFTQTYRIYRGRRSLDIETTITPQHLPEGDPWSNYYAARFAWNDDSSAVTRSILGAALTGTKDQRFEALDYWEIASYEQRTTLLFGGLPFHRKTSERMVDTILLCEGEAERTFHYSIAIDENFPSEAALDQQSPALTIPLPGPPRSGTAGWFFHLNARNVQILRLLNVLETPGEPRADWDATPIPAAATPLRGCTVRVQETEGRSVRAVLQAFRTPSSARQRDALGKTVTDLPIRDGGVILDLVPFEIADIELRW